MEKEILNPEFPSELLDSWANCMEAGDWPRKATCPSLGLLKC